MDLVFDQIQQGVGHEPYRDPFGRDGRDYGAIFESRTFRRSLTRENVASRAT